MINKNWFALDLHMHTLPGITGDAKKENENGIKNYSYSNFIDSLLDANISLCSITNHNYIHLSDYIVCKYLAKKHGINVLLGTELDVDDSAGIHYHMACIFETSLSESLELQAYINKKSNDSIGSSNKLRFDADDIGNLISKYRIILIPHSPNKNPGIPTSTQEDVIELMKKVKEGYLSVLDERSHWDLGYIKNAISDTSFYKYADDIGAVFFSDNKDWAKGEYKKRLKYVTCMNAEPTFKGLIHCLTNPTERFTFLEYVPTYSNYISRIEIKHLNKDSYFKDSVIELKPGYNCVIGRSGSGKSLIIHLLKKYLLDQSSTIYSKYDNSGASVTFFDENNIVIKPKSINAIVGESIFGKLLEAIDADDSDKLGRTIQKLNASYTKFVPFNNYKKQYADKIQRYFLQRKSFNAVMEEINVKLNEFSLNYKKYLSLSDLSIVNVDNIPSIYPFKLTDEEIQQIGNYNLYFSKLKDISAKIKKVLSDSDLDDSTIELEKKYKKAYDKIIRKKKEYEYKIKKIMVVNEAISDTNGKISENAQDKSKLEVYFRNSTQIICNTILKEYLLRNKIANADLCINISEMNCETKLNKEGNIAAVEKVDDSIFRKAAHKDRKVYNTFSLGISNDHIYDLTQKSDAKEFFDTIFESPKFEYKDDIVSAKIFNDISPTLTLMFNGQDVKALNSGDIAKTYLKNYFENQLGEGNSIVIYDQLENDVDKEFIKSELLTYISDLKKKMQLIVVTHDPIIAVNGDPVNYVIATKDDSKMIGYRSFVPESEVRDELETLANTVDGSKDVIRERYMVYKGENL